MVSRFLWWAPFGALVLFFAVIGFRYGAMALSTTETEVINRYAAQYLEDAGGSAALTDCVAYPSDDLGIWLVVRCAAPQRAQAYEYFVNRVGGLEYRHTPKAATLRAPQA